MSELEQFHDGDDADSRWSQCCQLFGINKKKTGIDETVPIFGIKTPLYQYQAFALYLAMIT
jgi:hypothetical protein